MGAEGLDFMDGRDLVLADSASGFAQAVVGLLSDPRRRSELSHAARRKAEGYDWLKIAGEFRSAVTGVAQRHGREARCGQSSGALSNASISPYSSGEQEQYG